MRQTRTEGASSVFPGGDTFGGGFHPSCAPRRATSVVGRLDVVRRGHDAVGWPPHAADLFTFGPRQPSAVSDAIVELVFGPLLAYYATRALRARN